MPKSAEGEAPCAAFERAAQRRESSMDSRACSRVAGQGVQIAIANGGGLRASIDAGPITMGEVMTVLPFQNTLSTFEVTGATLLEALLDRRLEHLLHDRHPACPRRL